MTTRKSSRSNALLAALFPLLFLAAAACDSTITGFSSQPVTNNADLSALTVSQGTLTPAFNRATLDYTAAVPNGTNSISITPTTASTNSTVTVNGTAVASGGASAGIPLIVGATTINVVVTAQNTTTTRTYTVTVNRAP
jgi:hypothetical protein